MSQNTNFEGGKVRPIYVNGQDVLRRECSPIDSSYPELPKLLRDMFATMEAADGVGLAAPQIGLAISLFAIDLTGYETDQEDDMQNLNPELGQKVFINPVITEVSEEECPFKEGCLSVPGINENVCRPESITIEYMDENFEKRTDTFDGMWARVIQHEYSHLQGKLFVDEIAPIRKQLIKKKLDAMTRGKYKAHYRTK
ncbi:MAG: peptide deformylase [Rikenellaceae bacterium]